MLTSRTDGRRRRAVLAVWAGAALALGTWVAASTAVPGLDFGSGAPVQAAVAVENLEIEPGGTGVLPIRLDFPGTHHLNSQPIPSFAVKEPAGIEVGVVKLQGDHHFDKFLEADIYEGLVTVLVELSADPALSGRHTLKGELTYYPCSDADMVCFEQVDAVQVDLNVERGSSPLKVTGGTLADRISDSFSNSIWLAYLLVFVGGILASFTPCVYPMIPITVAVIGAGSAGSKSKGFKLSLIYVLGIAITYSILGAAAAGTGKAFGSFTQTFPVLLGIGLLLIALGAAMFGFFEIQPPAFMTRLQSKQGKGLIGIFLMGAVTGLVASPCLGPVLIALLAWIAKTGDVVRGFTLLFVFAAGMGVLLVAIGTFAGVLTALPKSGSWMVRVKEILGTVLAAVGVYYLGLALATRGVPEEATWTVALGMALVVLGYLVKGSEVRPSGEGTEPVAASAPGLRQHMRRGAGVLIIVLGAYSAIVGLSMGGFAPSWMRSLPVGSPVGQPEGVLWSDSYEAAMDRAKELRRPVMIDFHADWCVYCKKLDSDVFTDEGVREEAGRFVAVKVDADRRKDLVKSHAVLGLPTIVFLDSGGSEAARVESYVKADKFLELMKTVR